MLSTSPEIPRGRPRNERRDVGWIFRVLSNLETKELLKMDPFSEVFNSSQLEPKHLHQNVMLTEQLLVLFAFTN